MATRVPVARVARILAAGMLLATILPSAAAAAPPAGSCAAEHTVIYSAPAPAGLRTEGTHRVQWKAEYVDASTGELISDDGIMNQITIDPAAPAYPNTVLIRLFRNTTILADGEVISVDAIQPTQPASLHVQVSWTKGDKFFDGDFRMYFRYETRKNRWTEYQELASGPDQSLCVEFTDAVWRRNYGWE